MDRGSPGLAAEAPATQKAEVAAPAGDGTALLDRVRARLGELKLSDEQKKKIDELLAGTASDLKVAREQLQNADRQEKVRRFTEIMQKLRENVRSVLDPEQVRQLQQKLGGAGAGAAGEALARLRQALPQMELSDEQEAQIQEIFSNFREQSERARAATGAAAIEARQQLKASAEGLRQKILDILSAEQREKLQSLIAAPPATQPAKG